MMKEIKIKILLLLFSSFFCILYGKAQVFHPSPAKEKSNTVKKSDKTNTFPNKKSDSKLLLKISTDADCFLFIDETNKGILKKGEIKRIDLIKGEYLIKAISKDNKNDIYSEIYTVDATGKESLYKISLLKIINDRLYKKNYENLLIEQESKKDNKRIIICNKCNGAGKIKCKCYWCEGAGKYKSGWTKIDCPECNKTGWRNCVCDECFGEKTILVN